MCLALLVHGVLLHGLDQALNAGLILSGIEVAGVSLVAVEAGAGDAQVGGEAALHLGHVAGPGLAGTVVVDQNAINLVIHADALTPGNALLDTHGVGGLAVGAGHLVQTVEHEAEGGGVHDGGDVNAVGLQGLEQVRQLGPEGGISPKEEDYLNSIGFKSISLGDNIMRVETVPIYVLSVLNYENM